MWKLAKFKSKQEEDLFIIYKGLRITSRCISSTGSYLLSFGDYALVATRWWLGVAG